MRDYNVKTNLFFSYRARYSTSAAGNRNERWCIPCKQQADAANFIIRFDLAKMETHSCSFNIIPKSLACTDGASVSNAVQIEFKNCCKGNKLSRTYEVGRFFLMPYCDGTYVTESMQLYNVLTKYIRATYFYKKKAAAWLSPEFLEKYRTHYFFALRAGQPVYLNI